ncbi:MAG: hypothetical protein ACREEG_00385, partial [Phenylobacterium sp.]
ALAFASQALAQDVSPAPPPVPETPPVVVEKPAPARMVDASEIDLSMIRTADLSLLYFDPAQTYLTPYIARSFENSMAFQRKLFGWTPWDRTTVLLKDFSDYGNAAARSSPNNAILLDVAPLSQTFETFSPGERFFTLLNHEPVHVATMDVWNQTDARWRRLVHGKPMPIEQHPESILYNFLATPRVNSPRWYLEGSAVFMETWMAGGFGRAQGGYDEMVFRAKVRDGARFYSPLGLEAEGTSIDFQVGVNDYLYGTRFFSYLGLTYGPEKVIAWLRRDEGSAGYYSVQFQRVFGRSLDNVWQDWIAWEHRFQTSNLAQVQAYPATPVERLAKEGLGSISRAFLAPDGKSLIGAFRPPGVIANVGVLSLADGRIRRLADVKGAMIYRVTSLAYDPAANKAYYTADNYAFRDLMEVDVASGKSRMLLRDARIGDIVVNPKDKAIWGLRHLNGFVTLVTLAPPYARWTQVHTFAYGEIPFDLDISPDGTLLSASVGEINGKQSVRVYKLEDLGEGPIHPTAEFGLGNSTPESFVFSPDGRYLFGSSYYTGVSNIFRYELATQKVEAVSNASTGFFRPIPRADGKLVVYEYAGAGVTPVVIDPVPLQDLGTIKFLGAEIAAKHPIVKQWAVGSPSSVPLDSLILERGKYRPRQEMKFASIYPVVEGYRGDVAAGVHAIFEDPLQFQQASATIGLSPGQDIPNDERLHVNLEYKTLKWRLRYWHNGADFYDLFGPTYRSRRGDAVLVGYKNTLTYDPPRQLDFTVDVAGFRGLDSLPLAQTITPLSKNLVSALAGWRYTDTTKSLGAVDHEKGLRWSLLGESDLSSGELYPKVYGTFDIGAPIGPRHASVWLYTSAGIAGGDKANPLSQFYFGGFGNNYVDDGEVKRYREFGSFPGFDIDELAGSRFARSLLEFNLPPARFSNIGRPSLFLSSIRPAAFAGVMAMDPANGAARTFETVGGQVDFNFTVALRLPMVFSVGVASGFDKGRHRSDEVMISLKVL